jgi:hypothetical protein
MKKGVHNFNNYFLLGLLFVMCVFSVSCGLDVYYILYPPSEAQIVNENTEALGRYFSFRTADVENSGMDIFTGTTVIYKIYNTLAQLTSDSFSINNSNSEFSDKGYNRAVGLGYQKLLLSNNQMPLVEKDGTDRTVEIRLFTEGYVDDPYQAGIKISGQYVMDGSDIAIPLRKNESTFAFYSTEKNTIVNGRYYLNSIPEEDNIDVKFVQLTEENTKNIWYVNAYAVSMGMTSDFSYKYSQLEPLGYIVISEEDFNN